MDELEIIQYLIRNFSYSKDRFLKKGIGDDCAVLEYKNDKFLLLSTDSAVEDVHFLKRNTSLKEIFCKSIIAGISDVCSCAGKPLYLLLNVGISKYFSPQLRETLRFLKRYLNKLKLKLIGGNLSSSKKTFVDATVLGIVAKDKLVLRNGAEVGDYIFVSRKLGVSKFIKSYTHFIPPLKEVRILVNNFKLNSMIDISDGLVLDLYRILEASKKGALIFKDNIPLYKGADFKDALYGGEEYCLLFTLSPQESKRMLSSHFRKYFYFLGYITSEKGLYLKDKRKVLLSKRGYVHEI